MKGLKYIIGSVSFLFILLIVSIMIIGKTEPLETQNNIEIDRYVGKWYSIYEYPNWFQKNCSCTTAEYDIIDGETISVLNTCGNSGKNISGTASLINPMITSELEVDFGFFRKGDYNIIYIDDNYDYAIVGSKDRDYLWYLSRYVEIPDEQVLIMNNISKGQNFDTTKLVKVEQNCN